MWYFLVFMGQRLLRGVNISPVALDHGSLYPGCWSSNDKKNWWWTPSGSTQTATPRPRRFSSVERPQKAPPLGVPRSSCGGWARSSGSYIYIYTYNYIYIHIYIYPYIYIHIYIHIYIYIYIYIHIYIYTIRNICVHLYIYIYVTCVWNILKYHEIHTNVYLGTPKLNGSTRKPRLGLGDVHPMCTRRLVVHPRPVALLPGISPSSFCTHIVWQSL